MDSQPEAEEKGRQGRGQRLELQGLLPSVDQDLSPGLKAGPGQRSTWASPAGRGLEGLCDLRLWVWDPGWGLLEPQFPTQ